MFKNGKMWLDDMEKPIQAHGGMIMNYQGHWYWYGEDRTSGCFAEGVKEGAVGVSCYSSENLMEWHKEGLVFDVREERPNSVIKPGNILERPKVVYNKKTNKFVLWMHVDNREYSYAGVAVAVSDKPTGPFTYVREMQPNRQDSRDMTVFVDDDETAYLVHSSNWNKTTDIARLTEDYLNVDGYYMSVLIDQEREAHCMIHEQGMYYLISSGCTGWNYNSALYAESPYLFGKWKLIDNPCEGVGYRDTFGGQSTYIFRVKDKMYLMLDHWNPMDVANSGYSILPLTVDKGRLTVTWTEEFSIS